MIKKKLLLLSILLGLSFQSLAGKFPSTYPETASDFMTLPPYCKARAGQDSANAVALWQRRLGANWIHVHHFCAGLHSLEHMENISFGSANAKEQKLFYFKSILGETSYMETHGQENISLFPFIYCTKVKGLIEFKHYEEAKKYLNKAINLNPKYSLSYFLLADVYQKTNNITLAKKTLEDGLKYSPKSKRLKRKLKKVNAQLANPNKK